MTMAYLYLLHIDPPLAHASHYLGFTERTPEQRLHEHTNVPSKGSPLVQAAVAQGSTVTLARVWDNGTRTMERMLKNRKNSKKLCPCCQGTGTVEGQ
jgi:hypothetical protein